MRNQPKNIKLLFGISLLIVMALVLSACGAVPANTYAGLTADEKNLYISDSSFFFAVDPGSASIKWKYPQKADSANLVYAPASLATGWVYVGTYGNAVYGFKLEGLDTTNPTPVWTFNAQQGKGRIIGGLLAINNQVLVPSTDSHIYALNATDGTVKWNFKGRSAFWSQPASDGKLVFQAGMDHFLYALDLASGTKKWELDLGGPVPGGVVMSKDGLLYVSTLNSEFIAVDTNSGRIAWRKKLAGNSWSAALLNNGQLYFGTDQSKIYILNSADGKEIKTVDAGASITASPVFTKDAVVFVTESGTAFSLSLDGSNKVWTQSVTKGNLYSSPVVIGQQVIYSIYQGDHVLGAYDFSGGADQKWNAVTLK